VATLVIEINLTQGEYMKALFVLGALIASATVASAAQLPSQTLYVKPINLERQLGNQSTKDDAPRTYSAYVAYTSDPTTAQGGDALGGGIEVMTEDVAVTLKNMTVDRVYKCDAHVWNQLNKYQVFQLGNCK